MAKEYLTYINHLFQLIALCIGIYHYINNRSKSVRNIIVFLSITLIVDFIARQLPSYTFLIYNSYMIYYFLFFLFWFKRIINDNLVKNVIYLFAFLIVITTFYNSIFQEKSSEYLSYTFIAGTILIIIIASIYFIQIVRSDEILTIKSNLSFWITLGVLLFSIGMIPVLTLQKYMDLEDSNAYYIILISLNFILYGCFSLGFIWNKKN